MTRSARIGLMSLVMIAIVAALAFASLGPVREHPFVALGLVVQRPPGTLPVPVEGIGPRQLRDTWNGPRSGGRKHKGIDIFAPRGTPIRSTTPGIVATVGTNRLGGKIVTVFGPSGEWHYYAHLERYSSVRAGDVVGRGTILGFVGDSGNARGTPPHLHYGIYRPYGGATNPYRRLAAGR